MSTNTAQGHTGTSIGTKTEGDRGLGMTSSQGLFCRPLKIQHNGTGLP